MVLARDKENLFQTICFTFVAILLGVYLKKITDSIDTSVGKTEEIRAEPMTFERRVIYIGDEVSDLKELYEDLSECFGTTQTLRQEIIELHTQVEAAKVCSKANRYFNSLDEKFNEYNEQLAQIQRNIELYEEKCKEYEALIDEIPQFLILYREKQEEFHKEIEPLLQMAYEEKQKCFAEEEEMKELHQEAKQIADDFFALFFDLMCRLVSAEARGCPAMEQYFVANVVENRIEHERFPDTLYEVVFSGAYEPTSNGGIDLPATASVKANMELYLRGRIETDMPANVVYQSRGIQGSGIWKAMESGHYFCFY